MACADPFLDEDRFITDLETAGAMLPQRGVLFPAHDDCVVAVARHKERLERYFAIPIPAWEHLRTLADKELQVALARRAGVDAPLTAVLDGNVDVLKAAEEVPFPAVLKPSVPLALVRRKGFAFRLTSPTNSQKLTVAFVPAGHCCSRDHPGDDDRLCIAACYHDARPRPVAVFTGRLRQHPRGFGVTAWARADGRQWLKRREASPRVTTASRCGVQTDPETDASLMEVNARVWDLLPPLQVSISRTSPIVTC